MADESVALEWRPVQGFPDYEIREDGVVRRITAGWTKYPPGHVMKQQKHNSNMEYLFVGLRDASSKKHSCLVHQIVAKAFLGPKPGPNFEVGHIDGNCTNNHYTNLKWTTRQGNIDDRREHDTNMVGIRNAMAKLNDESIIAIRKLLKAGHYCSDVAVRFGVAEETIRRVQVGISWSHVKEPT